MSTEVQPPSPPPEVTSFQQMVNSNFNMPPTAFATQASKRRHGRSSSFGATLMRILPSQRPEKGHTLRTEIETRNNEVKLNINHNFQDRSSDSGQSSLDAPVHGSKKRQHELAGAQKPKAIKRLIGSIKSLSRKSRDEDVHRQNSHESRYIEAQVEHSKSALQPLVVPPLTFAKMPAYSEKKEMIKSQQMYEKKKARREQRRSLQESGDFLGVQGANPRTGYWDISDATSSSGPSQMSEETQILLAKQAQDVAEKNRRYEESHLKQKMELQRVQALRDEEKRAKLEQKKRETSLSQGDKVKWELNEKGWSSVVEPAHSPIEQSLAGRPVSERPKYRLFPMPSSNNPALHKNSKPTRKNDNFGSGHKSPLASDGINAQPKEPAGISKKPAGSDSRRTEDGSTNTIIRSSSIHIPKRSYSVGKHYRNSDLDIEGIEVTSKGQKLDHVLETGSLMTSPQSFLDQKALFNEAQKWPERKATAISSRSASTNQIQIHRALDQSPKVIKPDKRIISLNGLPQVFIRDPIAARDPLSSLVPRINFPVWSPPTILETKVNQQPSCTSTSITTITGPDLHLLLPQIDGAVDDVAPAKVPKKPYKSNGTTLRNSSPRREQQRLLQNQESPIPQADIGTLSETYLTPTKERTARLCRAASAEDEDMSRSSTPISISMFPLPLRNEAEMARNAAQLAFHHLQHGGPQQTRSPSNMTMASTTSEVTREMTIKTSISATSLAPSKEDQIMVKHPTPRMRAEAENNRKIQILVADRRVSSNTARTSPAESLLDPLDEPLSIQEVMFRFVLNTWDLVEPVFNTSSTTRKRWSEESLTLEDIIMLLVAGIFTTGGLWISVVITRLLIMMLKAIIAWAYVFLFFATA